jgi:hypothetical protein
VSIEIWWNRWGCWSSLYQRCLGYRGGMLQSWCSLVFINISYLKKKKKKATTLPETQQRQLSRRSASRSLPTQHSKPRQHRLGHVTGDISRSSLAPFTLSGIKLCSSARTRSLRIRTLNSAAVEKQASHCFGPRRRRPPIPARHGDLRALIRDKEYSNLHSASFGVS